MELPSYLYQPMVSNLSLFVVWKLSLLYASQKYELGSLVGGLNLGEWVVSGRTSAISNSFVKNKRDAVPIGVFLAVFFYPVYR